MCLHFCAVRAPRGQQRSTLSNLCAQTLLSTQGSTWVPEIDFFKTCVRICLRRSALVLAHACWSCWLPCRLHTVLPDLFGFAGLLVALLVCFRSLLPCVRGWLCNGNVLCKARVCVCVVSVRFSCSSFGSGRHVADIDCTKNLSTPQQHDRPSAGPSWF